ncbi:MAG: ABC transporter permease [Lautropia sp.]|nr:ABC transporter permease [Lautropia sp.]
MSSGHALNGWSGLLVRRGFQIVALAITIGTICFLMIRSLPGDMAMRIAAGRYGFDLVDGGAADTVRTQLGEHLSGGRALLGWLADLLRFDLGRSLVTGDPVLEEVGHQLGATIRLSAAALLLATLMGLPLGLRAGLHPDGTLDRVMMAVTPVLRATPPFLLAVLLMLLVAVKLGTLPVAGDEGSHSLLLPGMTLALGLAAGLARVVRNTMIDVSRMPSYEFARTKGLSDWQTLCRHGLRNAAIPVVAYLGVQAMFLVEGTVVVETLFAWPGIGHALVHAIFARDVPVIQGTALMIGLLFVGFNLLIDAICLLLDPRQRQTGTA